MAVLAVVAGGLLGVASTPTPAVALDGSQFDPSYIISDSNFYATDAMSAGEIQTFLESKVSCQNSNCLAVKRTDTVSRAADVMCPGAYAGAAGELTSMIIYKVQQACGISAKVLLVTLQKEQGLITAAAPSASKLERAMGYACPDSANGACDPTYAGLYNQLYRAAWQFKRYGNPPGTTQSFTWFPVGRAAAVQYHPDAVNCAAPVITIQNRATAALYYYTPYQPNAAALANLFAAGDSCSSYGNRNFWAYYSLWFGSPTVPLGTPDGQWETTTSTAGTLTLTGWAFDRDLPTLGLQLDIQVGSSWYQAVADKPRSSVAADYPDAGPNHGFQVTVPASGTPTVCIYVQNVGRGFTGNLGCRTVQVADGSPVGAFSAATGGVNSVRVQGWAVDTDRLTDAVQLDVQVGGAWFVVPADDPSSAVAAALPGVTGDHGFDATLTVAPGDTTVCIYARNTGAGAASSLGCRAVSISSAPPVGALETVVAQAGGVSVSGWAGDPDTPSAAVVVDLQVGSKWYVVTADRASSTAQTSFPAGGPNHGFVGSYPTSAGAVTVCAYPRNTGLGSASSLGCRTVTVASGGVPPVGALTTVTTSTAGVAISGWAVDSDALSTPVVLDVQVGSTWSVVTADRPSSAAQSAVSGAGPNHGFDSVVPAASGSATICIYLRGIGGGGDASLGCSTVVVPAGGPPVGAWSTATASASGIQLAGWAVDPDRPADAVAVEIQANSQWFRWPANGASPQSSSVLGAGTNHGFAGSLPLGAGTYTVCVYVKNVGLGYDISLGCRTLAVRNALPTGALDTAVHTGDSVLIGGWALDPDDLTKPVTIDVQAGSTWYTVVADQTSATATAAYPGGGPHGFSAVIPTGPGTQNVCLYPRDLAAGASSLGCRQVTGDGSPIGVWSGLTAASGTVKVSGWVVDPSSPTQPVVVDVQVGTRWSTLTANASSSEAAAAMPAAGAAHGFDITVPTTTGTVWVCLYPRNVGAGAASSLGCRSVTVP